MATAISLSDNLLLGSLRSAEQALLESEFEPSELQRGDVVFGLGDLVTHVLFPCKSTMISLVITMVDGRCMETVAVGHEGAIGGVVSLGYLPAFSQAVVQVSGPALRIEASRLQAAKARSPVLRNLFTRYSDCLLAQVLQAIACTALHPIEQRCAKALLTLQERLGTDSLPITQDVLADMLGVRRTYISGVLRAFQDRGIISVARGRIGLVQRERLEAKACECHARVREHFAEVMGAVYEPEGKLIAFSPPSTPKRLCQTAA